MSDHSYESGRYFGINHEDQFIPFNTECSTIFFNYFVPTDDEMNTFPHMVLKYSEFEWDPHDLETSANRTYGDNDVRVNAMKKGDKISRVAVEHESNPCLSSISRHLVPWVSY